MRGKREVNKVLKDYGKALYKSRLEYIRSFNEDKHSLICTVSYRHLMKRFLVVILVLIIAFSLFVIGGNALGIKILDLSFFEKKYHTVVTKDNNTNDNQKQKNGFYKPSYIPGRFFLVDMDEFGDVEITYSYTNDKEEYFSIIQSTSNDFIATIDNENCEIHRDTIEGIEARIYIYHDIKKILVLLKKEDVYIQISGAFTESEAREIAKGLYQPNV